MLKMNQKIKWTKTELKKFAEYDALESEGMCFSRRRNVMRRCNYSKKQHR